jgi:hypothetical protein
MLGLFTSFAARKRNTSLIEKLEGAAFQQVEPGPHKSMQAGSEIFEFTLSPLGVIRTANVSLF